MRAQDVGENIGGLYWHQTRQIATFHGPWAGRLGSTIETLAHEATHQFEHLVLRTMEHAPIFLVEGLATFFEGTEVREDGEVVVGKIPLDRIVYLKRAIRAGDTIPIADVIRTPQSGFSGAHYAHAWGLLHWMVYGPEKKGPVLLDRYWGRCATRLTRPDEFFEELDAIGYTPEKLERAWKEWVLGLDPKNDPAVLHHEKLKRKGKR